MIRTVLLAAVAATALFSSSSALAQMPPLLPAEALVDHVDEAKAAWLRDNVVISGPIAGGLTFDLPADFYTSKLILLGESHGVAAPQVLDLELLTHLNARIGLTDYLAEVDPVQGAMLNRYLETGDEAVLDRVFDYWSESGAQWGNAAFEAKVRGIRALNQTLPAERRVRILGIDAIQDWPLFAEWIAANGGTIDVDALTTAAADRANPEALATLAQAAVASLSRQTPETVRLSGVLTDLGAKAGREATIFNTYGRAVRSGELGDRPAYGLWGVYHVMQAGVNQTRPFAMRVKESDLPAAQAMTSLIVLSLDSAVQIPAPTPQGVQRMRLENFNIDGPYVMVQGAATLRAASLPNQFTIFDPGAAGSPIEGGDFMNIRSSVQRFEMDEPTAAASTYAQYVGVFRNSDWAAPRE